MPTQPDNSIVRIESIKTWDKEDQQKLEAQGREGERYGGTGGTYATPRVQNYGFSGHAPNGSQGVTLGDGNPDKMMFIGLEHPEYRPRELEEGEWKLYDKWGHFCYAQESQWYFKVGESEMWLKDDGTIHLKGNKIILEVEDKVYIGGPDADLEVAMRGSMDNDSEGNGPDALVGNLAIKANVI